MVKHGDAHLRDRGKLFHVKRLRVVRPEPSDGPCRPVTEIASGSESVNFRGQFAPCLRRLRTEVLGETPDTIVGRYPPVPH